jgi:hypothetical protein
MLLSAWIRLIARENGDTFTLINSRPKGRDRDERDAERLYQHPSGETLIHVQQLVGVLWDLVPYCEDRSARIEILSNLWPQKGQFQQRAWPEIQALAEDLARTTKVVSGLDITILPEWLNKFAKDTIAGKSSAETMTTLVAKKIAMSKIKKGDEPPAAVFLNGKIRSFYDAFGMPGIKRLAESSRPAVALVITTDFRNIKHGESDLQRTRELLTRTEELIDYLMDQGDLSEKHLLGGPFSACVEDLKGMVLSATALERFSLSKSREYEERCQNIGLLNHPGFGAHFLLREG